MLAVKLICVGKLKEAYWRDAVAEYEKRLRPLCKWELIELPEARLPSGPSQAEIAAALEEPEAAVKSRYYRLIGRLRKEFGADGS